MNFKNLISTCIFLFVTCSISAQQSSTYTNEYKEFNRALALHNENLYLASQEVFNTIKSNFDTNSETRANCEYFIADCAIKLGQPNADNLMLAFVENYPTSTKQNNAFLETGNYDDIAALNAETTFNYKYSDPNDEFSPVMNRLKNDSIMAGYFEYMDGAVGILITIFILAMSIVLWNTGLIHGTDQFYKP